MALTGKTGADAIFKALKRIAIVLSHYSGKLSAVVVAAQAAGAITSGDAAAIEAFLVGFTAALNAFEKLAEYAGF